MATDTQSNDRFGAEEKKSGGGCSTVIIGCLVTTVVLAAIACGLGYYVYINLRSWGADLVQTALIAGIEDTDLPVEQKEGMKQQIKRVTTAYKEGDIGFDQIGEIVEKLSKSPAFTAIPVEIARVKYVEPSGLSDEEKADAVLQLQRVARGAFEEKISEDELKNAMDGHIADIEPDGNLQFREDVSDEQLREFITELKDLADSKQIPDENFNVDLAAELKKAVDEVLEGKTAEAANLQIEVPDEPSMELQPSSEMPANLLDAPPAVDGATAE